MIAISLPHDNCAVEPLVIYEQLQDSDHQAGTIWHRTVSSFTKPVTEKCIFAAQDTYYCTDNGAYTDYIVDINIDRFVLQ